MKKSTYTTTRFDVDKKFYVEVSPNEDIFEFVLCRDNYKIKSYMFGLLKEDCPEEKWEEIIKNNVIDYIIMFLNDMEHWDSKPMN